MNRLQGSGSLVLLAGDLSYADGYSSRWDLHRVSFRAPRVSFPIGFYSRWDTYARLMQPLAATVPAMSCGGNHEAGGGRGVGLVQRQEQLMMNHQ